MGQNEILKVLVNKRLSGDDDYFSVRDIEGLLDSNGFDYSKNLRRQINRLYAFRFIEVQVDNRYRRLYRATMETVLKTTSEEDNL